MVLDLLVGWCSKVRNQIMTFDSRVSRFFLFLILIFLKGYLFLFLPTKRTWLFSANLCGFHFYLCISRVKSFWWLVILINSSVCSGECLSPPL